MAAFYADENFPGPASHALRGYGHDVLTAQSDGRASLGIADALVLARASALGRTLLTHDRRDYVRLHLADASHAGIVVCKEDRDFDALARRIHVAISGLPILNGQLIRITRPNPPTS